MALIVEDGTGKADADAFASVAVVTDYCEKHGLPYNTGSFLKQTLSTWKRIFKLSLPSRSPAQRPLVNVDAMNDAEPLKLAA